MAVTPRRRVFLSPDGTLPSGWIFVVVAAPTGVVYATQCRGLATEEREVEGYLVPVGGLKWDADEELVEPSELTALFHRDGDCYWGDGDLTGPRLDRLRQIVAEVPFWSIAASGEDTRTPLALDESRWRDIVEAWVPVITPDGPGVLVWENCD